MNTNRYKIKYAVFPIYDYYYGIEVDTLAYVVGKCYLCSENKHYTQKGEEYYDYEVVFQWDPNHGKTNVTPYINPVSRKILNSSIVDRIYDNVEECQAEADALNKELVKEAEYAGPKKSQDIKGYTKMAYTMLNLKQNELKRN